MLPPVLASTSICIHTTFSLCLALKKPVIPSLRAICLIASTSEVYARSVSPLRAANSRVLIISSG